MTVALVGGVHPIHIHQINRNIFSIIQKIMINMYLIFFVINVYYCVI